MKRDETCESTVVPRVNRLVLRLPGDPSLAGGTLAELNGLKSKLSKLQTCEAVRSSAQALAIMYLCPQRTDGAGLQFDRSVSR